MQGKWNQHCAVVAMLQQLLPAMSDVICIKYHCQRQKQATEGQQRMRTDFGWTGFGAAAAVVVLGVKGNK